MDRPRASEMSLFYEIAPLILYVQSRTGMLTFPNDHEWPDFGENMLSELDCTEITSSADSGRVTTIIDRLSPKCREYLHLSVTLRDHRMKGA